MLPDIIIKEYRNYQVAIDYKPRPHYIIVHQPRNYPYVYPHNQEELTDFCNLVTQLIEEYRNESPYLCLHLGFSRTMARFHFHLISTNIEKFVQIRSQHPGYSKQTKDIKPDSYKRYLKQDQNQVNSKRPYPATTSILNKYLDQIEFDFKDPIIHLKSPQPTVEAALILLRHIVNIILKRPKKQWMHLCIRENTNQKGYRGWLVVDVNTYSSLNPNQEEWIDQYLLQT